MRTKGLLDKAAKALVSAVFVGTLMPAAASAAPDVSTSVIDEADRIMNDTYQEFAAEPHRPPFDWSTDGCSVPVAPELIPWNATFRPACVQHDFGYRNYGGGGELQLSPTRDTKNWIDGRFREEMGRICRTRLDAPACLSMANVYYQAVQHFGGHAFFG